MITYLSLSGKMVRRSKERETDTRTERQTQTGRHVETERDDWGLVFSPAELFVRSFVTDSTSHPDALSPDVRTGSCCKITSLGKRIEKVR